jgi:hypothetical protein
MLRDNNYRTIFLTVHNILGTFIALSWGRKVGDLDDKSVLISVDNLGREVDN